MNANEFIESCEKYVSEALVKMVDIREESKTWADDLPLLDEYRASLDRSISMFVVYLTKCEQAKRLTTNEEVDSWFKEMQVLNQLIEKERAVQEQIGERLKTLV